MVVAVTASVSAMTGTGLATKSVLIDGAKIKNGSITAKKLSSTALAPKGYRLLAAPSSATSRLHTSGTRTSGPYLATICSDGNIVFNQPCPATWTPAPAPVPTPGPAGPSGPDGKLGSAYPVGSIRVVWEFDGVSRPEFPRSIMDFQDRFATEAACRKYLFDCRWPEGFVCPGCGGRRSGQATRRYLWICTACGLQTSVTAGTVMHATRTPLRTWFWSAYLVATHHPGISAKQLQRQLGLTRYETAWVILHKLRRAMVAPERSQLTTEVEVDEFSLGGLEEGLKGGRQRGKKALVGVAVEVRGRGSGRLRLQILPDASASSLGAFVTATTATGTVVHTTAGRATSDWRPSITSTGRSPAARSCWARICCPARTAPSRTSRRGCTAPIAVPCPSTSTSSSFATTAAAPRWPPSRHCSDLAPSTLLSPPTKSPAEPPAQSVGSMGARSARRNNRRHTNAVSSSPRGTAASRASSPVCPRSPARLDEPWEWLLVPIRGQDRRGECADRR